MDQVPQSFRDAATIIQEGFTIPPPSLENPLLHLHAFIQREPGIWRERNVLTCNKRARTRLEPALFSLFQTTGPRERPLHGSAGGKKACLCFYGCAVATIRLIKLVWCHHIIPTGRVEKARGHNSLFVFKHIPPLCWSRDLDGADSRLFPLC